MRRERERSAKQSQASAYTLVEMVTVLMIMSIIGLTASYVIIESAKVYARTVPAMDASYKANLAAERMKREIRDLKSTSSITTLGATAFTFDDSSDNTIAYSLSGTDLLRNGDLLAKGTTDLSFSYWKDDGTTASSASDLHFVEVALTVQTGNEPYAVQMAAFPRALSP